MNFIKNANSLLNSSLGASFALGGNFGEQQTQKSSFIPKISSKYKTSTANTRICDLKNTDSATRTQIAESSADSADSQNLVKKSNKKSLLKFLLLFAFAKRRVPPNFTDSNPPNKADSQNLKGGLPRRFCESARNDKYLDSSLRKCFAQNDKIKEIHNDKNGVRVAESSLDSANQNILSLRDSAKQNRGKPPIEKNIDLQSGLPRRFCESARNDKYLDSSLRTSCFAQNDNVVACNDKIKGTHNNKIKEIHNDKNGVRVAESALDSAPSTNKANSAIADEFLGFCEVSDKDKTKVYRGSEPKRALRKQLAHTCKSLKSRCESEFAPKFDKDDFYFLLVALASLLSLIYLISGASVSYKEAILLRENSATIAKIANLSLAHFSHIFGLDFSAKLPNLIFHTLNLVLIYLISNKILKFKRDSVLCVAVYALIPGVIMQGGIINESIIALFMVLVICYAELTKRLFIYPLCVLAVFLGESALMLFLALCFYFAIKKCVKSALFALICLLANIYIYGIDISGAPRGNFLGVFSELALLYSPALFVYFIYAIYRNFAKGGANLLLYISGISLVTSVILSVRQDVDKEIYMFMSLCGIPLAIKQFLSGLRLRLPSFRNAYKRQFLVIAIILIFETFLLIFSKQIYKVSNDENLFLNQFYIAKEVASELKARNISRVSVEGRMQERLAFYGIKEGGQKLRRVKKGGNVIVEYHGKIIARYAI